MSFTSTFVIRTSSFSLYVFSNFAKYRLSQCFSHAFDRDPVENLLEEAADDHAGGFFAGEAAGLGVKNQLFVHLAGGAAVGAADVVGFDFEAGDAVGPAGGGEEQVVVPLVAVGLLGLGIDLDHAAPDRAGFVLQGGLVKEVA